MLAAFAAGALLMSVILALGTYLSARHYLIEQRERTALQQAYTDAALVKDGLRTSGASVVDVLDAVALPNRTIAYVRTGGEWYSSGLAEEGHAATQHVAGVVADGSAGLSWTRATDPPAIVVGMPLAAVDAEYYEVTVADELDGTLHTLRTALIVSALVTTLAGALLGWYAARAVLRPLNQVTIAAARISGGDLATRLDPIDDPDLATLVGSFNNMVDTVTERIDRDARFAADVAHELRTPLATLITALGVLEGTPGLSGSSALAVQLMGTELERFRQALEDLIALGRLDSGVRESEWETVPVTELVRLALADNRTATTADPAEVETTDVVTTEPEATGLRVRVDRLQTRRALSNLIRNADTHGGGLTGIRIAARGRFIDIHVEDAGPGVPPGERERIFERFARIGARGATGGSGLGLSIVERTVAVHGGSVWCRESATGGADFVFSLPASGGQP
ncbi:HAMP domain-containing protein [Jiangella ureilytica]|uniref:histidine kinase n=1 Tax=Jiangella ureilytica TaxID=2530374 RepID=A0A4R4RXD5_9ACTN|nr:ATP-binding protein [Jiangella ureilytica]TDC53293.1 HAMP domain-containing protein [Jiangella ureilytica]